MTLKAAGLLLTILVGTTASSAAESYFVLERRIDAFLRDLARDSGARINVSETVRGNILRTALSGTAPKIIETIAGAHDLDWFAYNGVHFVSTKQEAQTRIIRLGDLTYDDAMKVLKESALIATRFPISPTAEFTALSISAPPKLIAIVESVIEGIPSTPPETRPKEENTVRIWRGIEMEDVRVR